MAGSRKSPPSFSDGGRGHGLEVGSRSKQNRGLSETSTSGRRTLSGRRELVLRFDQSWRSLAQVAGTSRWVGSRVGPGAGRPSFASQVAPAVANHQSCRHQGPSMEVLPVTNHGRDGGPLNIQNPKHGGERWVVLLCRRGAYDQDERVWGCSGCSDGAGCPVSNNAIFLDERLRLRRGEAQKTKGSTSATRACSGSSGHLSTQRTDAPREGPRTCHPHWPGLPDL